MALIFGILAQRQTEADLIDEILKANVICVVYAVNDDVSISKITSYWLPLIRDSLGSDHKTPIILVGNKLDLVDYTTMEVSIYCKFKPLD